MIKKNIILLIFCNKIKKSYCTKVINDPQYFLLLLFLMLESRSKKQGFHRATSRSFNMIPFLAIDITRFPGIRLQNRFLFRWRNIRQARENRSRYTAQCRLSFTRKLAAPHLIFSAQAAGGDGGYSKSLRLVINGSWRPSTAGARRARISLINSN